MVFYRWFYCQTIYLLAKLECAVTFAVYFSLVRLLSCGGFLSCHTTNICPGTCPHAGNTQRSLYFVLRLRFFSSLFFLFFFFGFLCPKDTRFSSLSRDIHTYYNYGICYSEWCVEIYWLISVSQFSFSGYKWGLHREIYYITSRPR